MNRTRCTQPADKDRAALISELLLLPDGSLLVHNLTPVLAKVLDELGFQREFHTPPRRSGREKSDSKKQIAEHSFSRFVAASRICPPGK